MLISSMDRAISSMGAAISFFTESDRANTIFRAHSIMSMELPSSRAYRRRGNGRLMVWKKG